jgi:hypothetical protein
MDRVHKGGAKFDYRKGQMVQPRMDKTLPATTFSADLLPLFASRGSIIPDRRSRDEPRKPPSPIESLRFIVPGLTDIGGVPIPDIPVFADESFRRPAPSRFREDPRPRQGPLHPAAGLRTTGRLLLPGAGNYRPRFRPPKWTPAKQLFFRRMIRQLELQPDLRSPCAGGRLQRNGGSRGHQTRRAADALADHAGGWQIRPRRL